jgi:hypothetical protein
MRGRTYWNTITELGLFPICFDYSEATREHGKLRVCVRKFLFRSVNYLHKFESAVFVIWNSATVCILENIVKMMDFIIGENSLETTEKSRFFEY